MIYAQHTHDTRMATIIANSRRPSPKRPARRVERQNGQREDDKRARGKQAEGKRQGTYDTAGSLTEQEDGTAGRVKQDENMRQRIRYEPAIGSISSGIEYEMTRE